MSTISSTPEEQHRGDDARPTEYVAAGSERVPAFKSARSPLWIGALVGAAAGLISSGVMLWLGREWGGAVLSQLISERVTDILPLSAVRRGLQELEENAKPTALGGITLAQVFGGAIIGLVYAWFARREIRSRLIGGLALTSAIWLFLSLVAAPLGDVGLFARNATQGLWETQLLFAVSAVLFGAIVALFVPWPLATSRPASLNQQPASAADGQVAAETVTEIEPEPSASQQPVTSTRRTLLKVAGISALAVPALVAAGYIGRHMNRLRTVYTPELAIRTVDGNSIFATAGMPEEITPTDAFYVVSKNLVDPTVDGADWTLEIDGLVDRPMSLSYTDIMLRDSVEFISTLECISNRVGGSFISNAVWTGFPLRELLGESRLQAGVVDIELHAADGYVESIPLAEALAGDTMVVHSMNGEPLNDKHGYPLRLIVPGIFGMKNVKWLTAIKPVDTDIQGFWQQRDWSDIATVLTMSRIDIPKRAYHAALGETVRLGGVAFAGDRGISKVEVTLDAGETWQEAQLSEPLSNLSWRLWAFEYLAGEPGLRRLAVRATDGAGDLQTEEEQEALPDGATGWHRSWFDVLDANGQSVDFEGESVTTAGGDWVSTGRRSVDVEGSDRD